MSDARATPSDRLAIATPLRIEARAVRRGVAGVPIIRTGVGPEAAKRAVLRLCEHPAPALAVAGLCGALDPELAPGDVIVASALSVPDGETYTLDAKPLCDLLNARGIAARCGPLLCIDHVVRGPERAQLAATGAIAVDMESAWLARAAVGRPFTVLRVVVDGPNHELMSLSLARNGLRALRALREAAALLPVWADQATLSTRANAPAAR